MNTIRPIHTKEEYQSALDELEGVYEAKAGTPEGDYAEVLVALIERYEAEHFPIESPDPIEAIKIRMEDLNLKSRDLMEMLGTTSRGAISNILNKRRPLTLPIIRILGPKLGIPYETLVKDYPLQHA